MRLENKLTDVKVHNSCLRNLNISQLKKDFLDSAIVPQLVLPRDLTSMVVYVAVLLCKQNVVVLHICNYAELLRGVV